MYTRSQNLIPVLKVYAKKISITHVNWLMDKVYASQPFLPNSKKKNRAAKMSINSGILKQIMIQTYKRMEELRTKWLSSRQTQWSKQCVFKVGREE